MQQKLIAFIGGGNMAQAIILGLLKQQYPAQHIIVNDPNTEKLAYFAELGVQTSQDNMASVSRADVVLLAVKPQVLAEVCQPFAAVDFSQKLLISIAAGISTARLGELMPSAKNMVRVMPNTPALVSAGMSGLFAAQSTSSGYRDFAQALLSAVGKTQWFTNEQDLHAVTAGSGSSPAYFFLFMEAMQNALQNMGLSLEQARELAQQSALGAAKMAIENPQLALSTLRENVTSKGGTTAAALAVLNEKNLPETIEQAMQACVARSKEMEISF